MSLSRLMIFTIAILCGCSSLQVNRDKIAGVKSVAIIGYQGSVEMREANETSGVTDVVGAVKSINDAASGELGQRRLAQAQAGFAALAKKLTADLGWTIADRTTVASHASYQQGLKDSNNGSTRFLGLQMLPDVMRADQADRLNAAELSALAVALGVDAVAIVELTFVVGDTTGFALGGIGKVTKYPKAIVRMLVQGAREPEPLWRDRGAEGQPAKTGMAVTMGAEINEHETQALGEALDSGFEALVARYRAFK